MMMAPTFSKREQPILHELLYVLQAPFDINLALGAAYPLLRKLVPTDHGAMCISRVDDPRMFDWTVAEMPRGFFQDYAHMAKYDFVRMAVGQRPNVVLRDHEILPVHERTDIERHPLYQYAREHHMPIEQIMAVMIDTDPMWKGGLTLYRDKRGAFSERERQIVQFLTRYFANAMSVCRRYGDQMMWAFELESALEQDGTSVLVFDHHLKLVRASREIHRAFARCFPKDVIGADGLPVSLRARIDELPRNVLVPTPPEPWIPMEPGAGVVVSFMPRVFESGTRWYVFLDEVPEEWREKLGKSQIDVALRVAQGWDNALVTKDLGRAPATIRTHVYNIFNELGAERREMLVAWFRKRRR